MRPVVTDGQGRVALEAVRALGARGVRSRVTVAEPYRTTEALAARSRWCEGVARLPAPRDAQRWVEALADAVGPQDVVIPVSTNSVIPVAQHRDRIRARVAPIPPVEAIRRLNHTPTLLELAGRLGVHIPRTYPVRSHDDLSSLARDPAVRWPLVVKLCDDEGLFLPAGARYRIVRAPDALADAYRTLSARKPLPVVQEYVPGDGWGMSVLMGAGGEVLARIGHRRTAEFPARGGPSARCETVRSPEMEEATVAILREADWIGPAQAEFRRDARDGTFRLLEVNPRLWGSLPLARRAGVNLVAMWWAMACGERVAPVPAAPPGLALRFGAMAWASALTQEGWGRRLAAAGRAAADAWAGVPDGIEDPRDPGPGTCYRAGLVRRAAGRALGWARAARAAE